MKFLLSHATGGREEEIELNSLEELIALVDKEREDIIVRYYYDPATDHRELLVYDTYLE